MNSGKATKLGLFFASLIIGASTFGNSTEVFGQKRANIQKGTPAAIPKGTQLTIKLNNSIDSSKAQNGDPFTATVLRPNEYSGATLNGRVSSVKKSGKVKGSTELSLAFNRIKFTNGTSRSLSAEVVEVIGEKSAKKVDDEGNIESGGKGSTTAKRTGILGGAGAVIGAIAGGGKGAAIGALAGAGVGAGSSVIQGSKKIKLESGTELVIRITR